MRASHEMPLDFSKLGSSLFQVPADPQQTARVAELAVDAILPREYTRPESFKKAGDLLIVSLGEGHYDGNSDRLFFPAMYLYRHGLELLLKELIRKGAHFLGTTCDNPAGHSIAVLWNDLTRQADARRVLEAVWASPEPALLRWLDMLIDELHHLDPDGQTIRYARNRTGVDNPVNAPNRVDLSHFKACFDVFWFFLHELHFSMPDSPNITRLILVVDDVRRELYYSPEAHP